MTSGPPADIDEIPGWFNPVDRKVFGHFLDSPLTASGNLVELGAYLGKSAALIGQHRRPDETFYVVDLFQSSFKELSREAFERNYRAIVGDLPFIIEGLSTTVLDHVSAGSVRFLHIDASHQYADVCDDIASAEQLMAPGGVIAFDDYRNAHSPGVAAAIWGAFHQGRIHPVCITRNKLYAVLDDPAPHVAALSAWVGEQPHLRTTSQRIGEHEFCRVMGPKDRRGGSTGATRGGGKGSKATSAKQLRRIERRLANIEDILGRASVPRQAARQLARSVAKIGDRRQGR